MRTDGRRSSNIQDRRSLGTGVVGGGLGCGTIVVAILFVLLGGDPMTALQIVASDVQQQPQGPTIAPETSDQYADFARVVLADTEDVWNDQFRRAGSSYREPTLVFFSGSVRSACGTASAAVGPFYCGADQKIYIDLSFYQELDQRLGAPGDFARAYVLAHEVGHHVQNLTGTLQKVNAQRSRMSEAQANALSVRLELQADCYAGIWAHHAQAQRQVLEPGDIEEAMRAANAIGDDNLQRRSRGYVVPDSFTHGTSAQRMQWFTRGLNTGSIGACDTFDTQHTSMR